MSVGMKGADASMVGSGAVVTGSPYGSAPPNHGAGRRYDGSCEGVDER